MDHKATWLSHVALWSGRPFDNHALPNGRPVYWKTPSCWPDVLVSTVDVRSATADGSVTVKVSGRPFGGRVCGTTQVDKLTSVMLHYNTSYDWIKQSLFVLLTSSSSHPSTESVAADDEDDRWRWVVWDYQPMKRNCKFSSRSAHLEKSLLLNWS